jgi:hypothetical protein
MIRTSFGMVDLRKKRDPQELMIRKNEGAPTKETIRSGWLKHEDGKQKGMQSAHYQSAVKQSMLLASTKVELEDLTINTIDPQTGTWRTPEAIQRLRTDLLTKKQQVETGSGAIGKRRLSVRETLGKQVNRLQKHLLTKRSAKCHLSQPRYFTIDNGRLQVFNNYGQHAKVRKTYELSKAKCTYEWSKMPNNPSGEPFPKGKDYRICLQCKERPQGPLYLYPDGDHPDPNKAAKQVKNWERACKMSKFLQSAGDRDALSTVVRKVTGNVMNKGWQCLFGYSKEIQDTKKTVKTFAMRLMKVDYSRGWNKFRLTYMKRKQTLQLKADQQAYAARFLAQRMQSINASNVGRPPAAVKASMMTTIQSKFRHYRQEKIFDRVYTLGSQSSSRIQQAKKGLTMDCAFHSVDWKESLLMALTGEAAMELETADFKFKSNKSTYSEVYAPLHRAHVNVSDSLTMLSFAEVEEEAEHQQLSKSDWANFVNLDQISSVIVNAERQMAKKGDQPPELKSHMTEGVWLAINGPRCAWNKRVHTWREDKEMKYDSMGAADGMEVSRKLGSGAPCRVLIIEMAVRGSSVPRIRPIKKDKPKDLDASARGAELQSYMVITLANRSFRSNIQVGSQPRYAGNFRVEIPIASDDGTTKALEGLDKMEVGIDIMEVDPYGDDPVCLLAGKMALWNVFKPDRIGDHLLSGVKHLQTALHQIKNKEIDQDAVDLLIPLSRTLGNGATARKKISLYHVSDTLGEGGLFQPGYVDLQFDARMEDSPKQKWCVSPELQGCGLVTSLYGTHRGAWYNPAKEHKGRFISDNVPSFAEIKLKELTLPDNATGEKTDANKVYQFYLEARCNGTTVYSDLVTRPKKAWQALIKCQESKLNFGEKRLYVPIPPGSFCKPGCKIELAVYQCPVNELAALSFRDLLAANRRGTRSAINAVRVYHANFTLDGMQVDTARANGNSINMAAAQGGPPSEAAFDEHGQVAGEAAVLDCVITLRDRDYIKMSMTEKGESKRGLCVGDNAMLVCEEPLRPAKDELEHRRRFFPDAFDKSASSRLGDKIKLRQPCMSHEWYASGLLKGDKADAKTMKQKNIPAMAEDIIPYSFILPPGELEFNRLGCAGNFARIMEALAADPKMKNQDQSKGKNPQYLVDNLSHVFKQLPVTVLAVYANGGGGNQYSSNPATCDVELSASFAYEWESHPERAYAIPGSVMIEEFQDASDAHVRAAPPGTGDVGQRQRRRVVLRDVPVSALKAVHSTGFNIFDARFGTTEEALKTPPSVIKNDFNPRASAEPQFNGFSGPEDRRGGYCVSAGPVPADVMSCQYEWQMFVRANTEAEAYHFLTMLRQCVRMDFHQQSLKMHEFKQKSQKQGNMRYQVGTPLTMQSGYLEVVLVEARRLKETKVQKDREFDKWKHKITPEWNPYVVFKMKNRDDNTTSPHPMKVVDNITRTTPEERPIKNGEVVRIVIDGFTGSPHPDRGEHICIRFRGKERGGKGKAIPLYFALLYQDYRLAEVRLNDYDPDRQKDKGWGTPAAHASELAKRLPQELFQWGKHMQIDIERAAHAWHFTVNGERLPLLDFEHRMSQGTKAATDVYFVEVDGCELHNMRQYFLPQVDLVVRGSKQQQSPILHGTGSPNWSHLDHCKQSGGWLFKSPPIDPTQMPNLVVELAVLNHNVLPTDYSKNWEHKWLIGLIRIPVTGRVTGEGVPKRNYCSAKEPFNNIWVPLYHEDADGSLHANNSGELHIMTRWVANQQSQVQKRLPKTARAHFLHELKPKLLASTLREPIYELNMRCTYNPNMAKDYQFPLRRAELIGQHAEELFNTEEYVYCCDRRQKEAWDEWLKTRGADPNEPDKIQTVNVAAKRAEFENRQKRALWNEEDDLWKLEESLRRGIPGRYRMGSYRVEGFPQLWYSVTNAYKCIPQPEEPKTRRDLYEKLVLHSWAFKSDAMLQLQEDCVVAASWESSPYPQVMDEHLHRVRRARNVCSALITFSYSPKPAQGLNGAKFDAPNCNDPAFKGSCGIAYCESLLVIAFFMLLPQEPEGAEKEDGDRPLGLARTRTGGLLKDEEERNNQQEADVFWLLYTLIGAPSYKGEAAESGNGAFKCYYGVDCEEDTMESVLANMDGASDDIYHLNSAVSRYDRELWIHMTSLGFHLSSVFHGAFMRWFAFMMPSASVFRFWDLMFSETTRYPHPESHLRHDHVAAMRAAKQALANYPIKQQYPRHILIDLAYGALTRCRNTLLKCDSEREFRDCLIGFFEALYDPSTMIEITTQAERELWQPFSAENPLKVRFNPMHLRDYNTNVVLYRTFLEQFKVQNRELRTLVQTQLQQNDMADARTQLVQPAVPVPQGQRQTIQVQKGGGFTVGRQIEIHDQFGSVPQGPGNDGGPDRAQITNVEGDSNATITLAGPLRSRHQPGATVVMAKQVTDRRMTVKNVVNGVISILRQEFLKDGGTQYGGMFRRTADQLCELGPDKDDSVVSQAKFVLWTKWEELTHRLEDMTHLHIHQARDAVSLPLDRMGLRPPAGGKGAVYGEPTRLDRNEWSSKVTRMMGPGWNAATIFEVFMSRHEDRLSLNEFFVSLICCCKGTVGEKALGLFHLHSFASSPAKLNHIVPVLHHTKCVLDKVEGQQEKAKDQIVPPDDEAIKKMALHFKIYTHTLGEDMLLGEAFVPNLHPYLWKGFGKDQFQSLNIWGTKMRLPPGVMAPTGMRGAGSDPTKTRPYIGELNLAIKWQPQGKDETKPEVGQIGININSIKFDGNRVEAPKTKNPHIDVVSYDEQGTAKNITRWDPRNTLRHIGNVATLGVAYSGAYRGHLYWEETMRRDFLGHLHYKFTYGSEKHGWDQKESIWTWNTKWGDQYSTEDYVFRKDVVGLPSTLKPNTISLQACRYITLAILRRNLHYITNRQAMLIADSAFNRSGAVPGIIDAILVGSSTINHDFATPTQLKLEYLKQGKHAHDVKHQIVVEHEKQCNRNLGSINMWDPSFGDGDKRSLLSLGIHDMFPFTSKVLWIRYCRAGDGERLQVQIPVDHSGHFTPKMLEMDMPISDDVSSQAQMHISKEEFVSCVLANPMISESLRHLSSRDTSTKNLPNWQPIKLNVTISDPAQTQEDDDLFDVLNVRQSVLLEVWDHDTVTMADFLGECWLPPLGSLGPQPRQYVRSLYESNSDHGGSRPDSKKTLGKDKHITGELTFIASWTLPAEAVPEESPDDTLEARVKREEALHTGKLYLKIVKAEGLRHADFRRGKGSDPLVYAYLKNDCYDPNKKGEKELMWKMNEITKLYEPIFKTSYKRQTLNPEWNEETTVEIKTGAFEKKTRRRWTEKLHVTKRGRQAEQDRHFQDVMENTDEVSIIFGQPNVGSQRGGMMSGNRNQKPYDERRPEKSQWHDVQIFMGNTVREFKTKLLEACHKTATAMTAEAATMPSKHETGDKLRELAQKFNLVQITFKHAVTVFQPSDKLRSLAQQHRQNDSHEYRRLYEVEFKDPSSWQPLDPMCTFFHYATPYAIGSTQAQMLRISEGTEDYKLRNHRYRQFEDARKEYSTRLDETNTEDKCFCYGIYRHAQDGDSIEWRPAMADRPESSTLEDRRYKVNWLYTPKFGSAGAAAAAHGLEDARDALDEVDVLLAPQHPKVLGSGHFEHQEFLAQALDLHKAGNSDQEIARILNDKFLAKFRASQDQADSEPEDADESAKNAKKAAKKAAKEAAPPPITVNEVRHHLAIVTGEAQDNISVSGASGRSTPRGTSEADQLSLAGRQQPPSQPSGPSTYGPSGPSPTGLPAGPSGPSTGGPSRAGPTGPSVPSAGPARTGPAGPSIGARAPGAGGAGGGPQRG